MSQIINQIKNVSVDIFSADLMVSCHRPVYILEPGAVDL